MDQRQFSWKGLFDFRWPKVEQNITVLAFSSALLFSEINRTFRYFLANSQQIGRLESENKSLSKSLENTGGDKHQLQEMQAMVMKMAAAKAENVSAGEGDKYAPSTKGSMLVMLLLALLPWSACHGSVEELAGEVFPLAEHIRFVCSLLFLPLHHSNSR